MAKTAQPANGWAHACCANAACATCATCSAFTACRSCVRRKIVHQVGCRKGLARLLLLLPPLRLNVLDGVLLAVACGGGVHGGWAGSAAGPRVLMVCWRACVNHIAKRDRETSLYKLSPAICIPPTCEAAVAVDAPATKIKKPVQHRMAT